MKELKAQAKLLKPIVQVGKEGLSQGVLDLIERELDQKELIKIKFKDKELRDKAKTVINAQVIDSVGKVLVLYRRK